VTNNVFASGGRDGKIVVHDLRTPEQVSEFTFTQQVFGAGSNLARKRSLTLQKPSITGLASVLDYHLVSCESTTEVLSFFDLRMLLDQAKGQTLKKALVCQLD
jgi:hypothetical protein